ncbi:hypothetical protein BY458DRAFT_110230 [Sporodiniella umbellata]|nr:hypothetical protein BY458DRAFT_110230 [Sporodiniella umbellata]
MNLHRFAGSGFFRSTSFQSVNPFIKPLTYSHRTTTQKRCFQTRVPLIRQHPLSAAFIGFGIACVGIGAYQHFSKTQQYPANVRRPLRKALYYQQGKDLNLAIQYFNESITQALEASEMEKDGAPLTGIIIQLGTLQERMGKLSDARKTLTTALRYILGLENNGVKTTADEEIFQVELSKMSTSEQKKVVGIAQKLGDIAVALSLDKEAEKWYEWSVNHMLKVSSKPISEYDDTNRLVFKEEFIPIWLTKVEVSAALEAFGAFYASKGEPNLAIHLYTHALALSDINSCQSAVIMNNLTESHSSIGQFEEAKRWGQKGLDIAKKNKDELCAQTCGILLFNMGMLFEQTNEKAKAIRFYENARKIGNDSSHYECVKEANRAIKRIKSEKQA